MTARKEPRQPKARDANEAAVERAWPGVTCKWVKIHLVAVSCQSEYYVRVLVEGTAEVLTSAGVITQAMIDRLPPCGFKQYGREGAQPSAEVRRTTRGTYRVERSAMDGALNSPEHAAKEFAASLGIELVVSTLPVAKPLRFERCVGQRNRLVQWRTTGNLISVAWDVIQRQVASERDHREAQS